MGRLEQRLLEAKEALTTLEAVIHIKQPTMLERDGIIQRFEYSFESQWKFAKQYLHDIEGVDVASPKSVIRRSRETGILDTDNTALALQMVDDRNLTTHIYNEELIEEIYSRITDHAQLLRTWFNAMSEQMT